MLELEELLLSLFQYQSSSSYLSSHTLSHINALVWDETKSQIKIQSSDSLLEEEKRESKKRDEQEQKESKIVACFDWCLKNSNQLRGK